MPKVIKKKDNTEVAKSNYSRFGESYTSLALGIIVVIIGTVLLLSFARNRNINKTNNNLSEVPEGITEITQTNMETVIKTVRAIPSPTSTPSPAPTSKVPAKPKARPILKPILIKKPEVVKAKPTTEPAKSKSNTHNNVGAQGKTYTVQAGDNLWDISERNYRSGYNWVDIARANKLSNPNLIVVGSNLIIPKAEQKNATSKPASKVSFAGTSMSSTQNEKISGENYIIKEGDTLWDIALRAYGDGFKWTEIQRANKLSNPNLIFPGVKLKLPRK